MKRYFELRENYELMYGVINNIPEETLEADIIERIEVNTDTIELILIDEEIDDRAIDIEMDWVEIDFIGGIDEDLIVVDEILEQSRNISIEDKVVFSALSKLKKDNTQSISEVMKNSFNELK
jgi:hypothetical protein